MEDWGALSHLYSCKKDNIYCTIQLKCLEALYKKENSEVMKRIEVENRSQVS
jgi:hypothetical protein